MREIKFRAWSKKLGEILGGVEGMYDGLHDNFSGLIKDDNFIVMQYTGLKDKNGKEIYEGDILKSAIEQTVGGQIETIGVVEWDDNGYWKYDLPDYGQSFGINILFDEEYKVIGNIYENPKLLKV